MLKRILILLTLVLAQAGCTTEDGREMYKPSVITSESREILEGLKRKFLQLEDVKVGDGPIAAWGRKIEADIEVRYTDGSVVYHGPSISYQGMQGDVFIHNNAGGRGILAFNQMGIMLGLNGMSVGGKRRITVPPGLVCFMGRIEDASKSANPHGTCLLVKGNKNNVGVREEQLIVEATLTESCIPVFLYIPLLYSGEFSCRDSDAPQRDPSAPIWHLYDAQPSRS
jgi:hypothetical protein